MGNRWYTSTRHENMRSLSTGRNTLIMSSHATVHVVCIILFVIVVYSTQCVNYSAPCENNDVTDNAILHKLNLLRSHTHTHTSL